MGYAKAVRCSDCGINYPPELRVCRVCDGELHFNLYQSGPDEDWEEQVARLKGDTHDGSIYPHPPEGRCPRYKHEGRIFFKHEDLLSIGYRYLEGGSIVYVQSKSGEERAFYELLLYWPGEEAWMAEERPTEGVFANATVSDFIREGEGGTPT